MSPRRFLLLVAALLFAAQAFAASVAERSPFTQGHWWMPARAGSGFDIFNAGGQVAFVWYTYDEAGRPIWYNAQGDQATLGTKAWPLWREKWSDGRWAGYTVVGSVRLTVRHSEAIDLDWQVGTKSGTWNLQPFLASGITSEVDHTGHWYDPSHSGWGFTLTEQGDVLGGVLYTYDTQGEPTWVAGFERGIAPRVELFALTGSCPYCAYQPSASRSVGFATLDFREEAAITVHAPLSLPMAAGVALDGAQVTQLSRPASTRTADRRLATFDDDAGLKAYLSAGMMAIPVFQGVDFSPAPPTTSYSTTNLIEAGVDEADVVKTDGQRIYTYAYSNGSPQAVLRVASVGDAGASLDVLGTVPLAAGASAPLASAGLYLAGKKLVSVSGPQSFSIVGWAANRAWAGGSTYVEVLDASGTLPTSVWRAQIDGYLVASRRIGDRVYVVSRFVPLLAGFAYGAGDATAAATANRSLLAATPLKSLLPQVAINGGSASPLVGTTEVYVPPQGARAPAADMIVVTAIDLSAPRIAQSLAIVGTPDAVYASPANLYVASSRQVLRTAAGALLPVEPNPYVTDIHQIGLGAQAMNVVASGAIEGYLDPSAERAAFRMSEDQGRLRVVTGSQAMWSGNQNRLTILEPSTMAPGLLRTVSYLPNPQRPQPLGKSTELLYGVRFVGDRLYAVSFKKIDPLFIVDLSNASDPRIAGSLELPGFSEYLHPLPNGLLLGFGKDARPASTVGDGQFAWYQGLRLTLFDVRDASTLRELQHVVIGKRGSDSALLRDHHAFSILDTGAGTTALAFPASIHDGSPPFVDNPSYYYPWVESGLARFELRGSTADDAQLVQMPSIITQSAPVPTGYYSNDPAVGSGRSILFAGHAIYVGNGQFWLQDAMGTNSGPF